MTKIYWHATVKRDIPFDPQYTPFDHAILSKSKGVSRYTVACYYIRVMGYSDNATDKFYKIKFYKIYSLGIFFS